MVYAEGIGGTGRKTGPAVVSVMGLQDKIINRDNYERAKDNLPPNAVLLEIGGLNHSDFGNYGLQKGDGKSALDDEEIIGIISRVFCETD